jgi:hypothetical protein
MRDFFFQKSAQKSKRPEFPERLHIKARRERERERERIIMAGADPTSVKPNQFVELHGHAREVVERTFRFSPRTVGVIAIFGVGVPYLLYRGCVNEFNVADDKYERERKKFM